MKTLIALILLALIAYPFLNALYRVIRAGLRESEPEGRRQARVIKRMINRPGAWGGK